MNKQQFDVIIVGGGITGLSLAAALALQPLKIAVVAKKIVLNEDLAIDNRVSAITNANQEFLQQIGVWPAIANSRFGCFNKMQVWDVVNNTELLLDSNEINQTHLGHIIENRVITTALLQKLQTLDNVILYDEHNPISLQKAAAGQLLTLDNNIELQAQLVVGADGANSWVRQQLNIAINSYHYQQQAIVTTIKTAKPHRQVARQWFLEQGPLALLPLYTAEYCSIVWSLPQLEAKTLQAASLSVVEQQLNSIVAPYVGTVEVQQPLASFHLIMRHATEYVSEGVALVGDAAHTIHPLAGQGLNLGLQDVSYLADLLIQTWNKKRNLGNLSGLLRYQRYRKAQNLAMTFIVEGFKQTFAKPNGLLRRMGGLTLKAANNSRVIKKYCMLYAASSGFGITN